MNLNNWEGRNEKFLSNSFDEDSKDIIQSLIDINPSKIMEIGFGNNRLLPHILNALYPVEYYGFDKTETFINRAKRSFNLQGVTFGKLNIENLDRLKKIVNNILPSALILRSIIEHLPSWKDVMETLNDLEIPNILIYIYTDEPVRTSWSMIKSRRNSGRSYTVNFIRDKELDALLNSYLCINTLRYNERSGRFKHYEKIK